MITIEPNAHTFDSTAEAYDATQCSDDIETGAPLLVESEQVVGLAYTWPFAVTVAAGEFHTMGGDPAWFLADAGITADQVAAAVAVADVRGFPVAQWARDLVREPNPVPTIGQVRDRIAGLVRQARTYQSALLMAARNGNAPIVATYRAERDALISKARALRATHAQRLQVVATLKRVERACVARLERSAGTLDGTPYILADRLGRVLLNNKPLTVGPAPDDLAGVPTWSLESAQALQLEIADQDGPVVRVTHWRDYVTARLAEVRGLLKTLES